MRGVVLVEAHDELGTGDLLHVDQRTERHLAAVGAAHIELADVLDVAPRVAFGFDEGLPLTTEAVEVIHQIAAHEGLHGGVDIVEIHLLLDGFFAVHIGIELRHGRHVGGNGCGDFRPLVECAEKCEEIFCEERGIVVAGPILEDHGDAARRCRRRESAAAGRRRRGHR